MDGRLPAGGAGAGAGVPRRRRFIRLRYSSVMHIPRFGLVATLLVALSPAACQAQIDTPAVARARAAMDAADGGQASASPLPSGDALAGWVEYAGLRRQGGEQAEGECKKSRVHDGANGAVCAQTHATSVVPAK